MRRPVSPTWLGVSGQALDHCVVSKRQGGLKTVNLAKTAKAMENFVDGTKVVSPMHQTPKDSGALEAKQMHKKDSEKCRNLI